MGIDVCFFPIFHSSSLLPTALPSPFKYAQENPGFSQRPGFLHFFILVDNRFNLQSYKKKELAV